MVNLPNYVIEYKESVAPSTYKENIVSPYNVDTKKVIGEALLLYSYGTRVLAIAYSEDKDILLVNLELVNKVGGKKYTMVTIPMNSIKVVNDNGKHKLTETSRLDLYRIIPE